MSLIAPVSQSPSTGRARGARRALAAVLLLGAAVLVPGVPGCGGSASLTGGSIPSGGAGVTRTGDITGTVVSAAAPDTPLEAAEVRAVLADGSVRTATTDSLGAFAFLGMVAGDVHLEVLPPPQAGAHRRDFVVRVAPDEETAIAVVLESEAGQSLPSPPGTLTLAPQAITVLEGEFVDFRVIFRQTMPPELLPLWIVEGNVGTISPHGRFHARRAGRGRVVALLADQRAVAEVTVTAARSPGPGSHS